MILQSFCHKCFCQKCSATGIVSQSLTLFEVTNPTRKRGTDGSLECAVLYFSNRCQSWALLARPPRSRVGLVAALATLPICSAWLCQQECRGPSHHQQYEHASEHGGQSNHVDQPSYQQRRNNHRQRNAAGNRTEIGRMIFRRGDFQGVIVEKPKRQRRQAQQKEDD